ncbi:trypsin-like serine protease [Streptomyces sp. ID05-26A]|nr:trypsin-like serine protease [Streptomyces sp. ID05-26A]
MASLFATTPAAVADSPDPVSPSIIGGNYATNAPWAARLFTNGQQTCTATIIAPQYVLTAKHCVDGGGTVSFRIGSLDQTTGGTVAYATQIQRHPSADLAIARLDRSVPATYSPLGTWPDVYSGQAVKVYGWGATCTDQPETYCQSQYLKNATLTVTSVSGRDWYGGVAVEANAQNGITAGGDSGGPMFASGRQVGVASTSDRRSLTYYTNVTSYRAWISTIAGV